MSTRVGHLNWHGGRQYASWSLKISSRTMRRFSMTRSEWVVMTIPSAIVRPARDRRVVAALDLDRADAAGAVRRELRLVAQRRDLDAEHAAGLEDGLALLGLDLLAVDRDADLPGAGHHRPDRGVVGDRPVAGSVAVAGRWPFVVPKLIGPYY